MAFLKEKDGFKVGEHVRMFGGFDDPRKIIRIDEEDYNRETQQIRIGLYNTKTLEPLPIKDPDGSPIGETWNMQ